MCIAISLNPQIHIQYQSIVNAPHFIKKYSIFSPKLVKGYLLYNNYVILDKSDYIYHSRWIHNSINSDTKLPFLPRTLPNKHDNVCNSQGTVNTCRGLKDKVITTLSTRRRRDLGYLTSLRETHKYTGTTNHQIVKVRDIILVHDDVPRLHW